MLKRDELALLTSCLNKAATDEPVFVLRAHDETASAIVRAWAGHYWEVKNRAPNGATTEQRRKYLNALETADMMDAWRAMQDARHDLEMQGRHTNAGSPDADESHSKLDTYDTEKRLEMEIALPRTIEVRDRDPTVTAQFCVGCGFLHEPTYDSCVWNKSPY